jgi:hypothetical protein
VFHPDATQIYGKDAMKSWAQFHPFGADEILYYAENGSKEAHAALCELIAEYTHRGERLTPALGMYNIRLVNPHKPRKHGPGKAENFLRDLGITLLVTALMDQFKLPARRSTTAIKPCACSIAAEALTRAGIDIPLGPKGVERVWGNQLAVLAGTRYAVGTKFADGFPAGYVGLFG